MELRRGGICRIFGGTLITHVERGMATGPWWNSNAFQHLNRHRVRPLVCWLLLKAPIQPGNFNDSNELTRETTVKFVNRTYTWLSARVLILRVDTHFFSPGFITTSMKKHLRDEREKGKEKKEQFSQRVWSFQQEETNCNLKIQHLFYDYVTISHPIYNSMRF